MNTQRPDSSARASVDAITVELVRERLLTIVREMRGNMLRAAFSSAVCELHDMSCAVLDAGGQLVALSEGDNPQHVFPILWTVAGVLEKYRGDIHPGDIFIHNDPLTGGTHLNDICVVAPLFVGDELAFFPVVRVHFEDVGGASPGSVSPSATDTFQEGVRIPVIRSHRRGQIDRELFDILFANMRVPEEREGDFEAMLGTARIAQQRLQELIADFGLATQKSAITDMMDRAEQRMRNRIRDIPDGHYIYEIAMDPRGENAEPLTIRARVDVAGDAIAVDFSGTSPQNRGPWNLGPSGAPTGVFMVLKALLDRNGPVNSGTFRPITVKTEPGTLLNPTIPVGFGGMGDVRRNLEMAVMGALAPVMPEAITGETKSTANQMLISGQLPQTGRPFIFYEAPPGGTGGFDAHDGNAALRTFLEGDFGSLQSVEAIEAKFPLRVERLELRPDSAGPGARRGGLGFRREIRVLAEEARFTVLSDRNVLPPYGVLGGGAGAPNRFAVNSAGQEIVPGEIPGKIANHPLRRDDLVISESSGGGGYGDPLDRSLNDIQHDLQQGYITQEAARDVYGAIFAGGLIDAAATAARRDELRARRVHVTVVIEPGNARIGQLRVGRIGPETARRAGLVTGAVGEILDSRGAPLRFWARVDGRCAEETVSLGPASAGLGGIIGGARVRLRALDAPAGKAAAIWQKRIEARA